MVGKFMPDWTLDTTNSEALANEIELPTAIAVLKADAAAALDAGRPVTAQSIRNEARELECRQQRLQKAILASRDQVPCQVDDLDTGTTGH